MWYDGLLGCFSAKEGTPANWKVTNDGLYSNAIGQGDSFMYSTTEGTNFVYSTDVTFKSHDDSAAALIFRNQNQEGNRNCYVANLNAKTNMCRFWRWDNGDVVDLIDEKKVKSAADNKYTLKVVAIDSWISYYVNDELVASTGDYTLQEANKGQKTFYKNGFLGCRKKYKSYKIVLYAA